MFSRRAASEFPNDNPELHDGLVWQSESVCGHALPTLRLRPPIGALPKVLGPSWVERARYALPEAPSPTEESAVIIEEVVAEPVVEAFAELEPLAVVEPEPFTARASVSLPESSESNVEPSASPFAALVAALVRVALDHGATRVAAELPLWLVGGRVAGSAPDTVRSRALLALGPAWHAVLDGTSSELAGCGEQPLDVWASELLATLLGAPGERETLRRALRRHGVAAFGMLLAA